MVEIDIDEEVAVQSTSVEDERKVAVRMSVIGLGQGGGNIADAFWKLGYRRVGVVNTTDKDMQRLSCPNRYVMKSPGGAGKNPDVGRKCAEAESDEILAFMTKTFGQNTDHVMLTVSLGGGTGTGSVFPSIKIAQEYMKSINKDFKKTVGVIATLPSRAESPAVFGNAVDALKELCALADAGEISPLVLVDNQKVVDMFGGASVLDAWGKANKNIAALFNVFNELSAQNNDHVVVTFDPEDYKSVLKSGILGFGRSKLIQVSTPTAIAEAVRANVKQGLLVDGLDISKATSAAGVLVASEDNMQGVPQDALESAFGALSRMLDPGPKTKLHRGVIISPSQPVTMYVLISGLGAPEKKIAEMEIKAGRVYP